MALLTDYTVFHNGLPNQRSMDLMDSMDDMDKMPSGDGESADYFGNSSNAEMQRRRGEKNQGRYDKTSQKRTVKDALDAGRRVGDLWVIRRFFPMRLTSLAPWRSAVLRVSAPPRLCVDPILALPVFACRSLA